MTTAWFVIASLALAADNVDVVVRVTLEPPVVPFHRQARFSITVDAPSDADVKLPDMTDKFGGLSVYGLPEYQAESLDEGRVRITETYRLDPIIPRDYIIEPVVVTWGADQSSTTPSPALRVRELTEEEIALAEQFDSAIEYPSRRDSGVLEPWQRWAIGLAAALALALLVWLWFHRRTPVASVEAHKDPWEIAYERLRTLDQRQYPKQGKYGPYYVDLSAILRFYIEDRFYVHAPEQTTPEFLSEITGSGTLSEDQERMLANFLRHCDRVKFAQYSPTVEEMEQSFTRVLQFVDETVPKPAEQAAA
jgi:hypothetical protein